jgi:hypothetical protein
VAQSARLYPLEEPNLSVEQTLNEWAPDLKLPALPVREPAAAFHSSGHIVDILSELISLVGLELVFLWHILYYIIQYFFFGHFYRVKRSVNNVYCTNIFA